LEPNRSPEEGAATGHRPDHDLHVEVTAPRFPDQPRPFTFEPDSAVGAAAQQAAAAFGYTTGTWSFSLSGVELDPSTTLAAAGVKSGDKLGLIDTGGGV
jgi:hypothetical protein